MRRLCAAVAIALVAVAPAAASARQPQSKFERQLVKLRHKADQKFGHEKFGRDIIRQGAKGGGRPSMKAKVAYRDALLRTLYPPKPVPVSAPASTTPTAAPTSVPASAPTGGGGGGCNGMSAESGSAGYNAGGPGGHFGCYQIGMEHYAPGGSCSGLGTDPAGQDACAARICQTEGAGAWTNSAGQNPCARLGG